MADNNETDFDKLFANAFDDAVKPEPAPAAASAAAAPAKKEEEAPAAAEGAKPAEGDKPAEGAAEGEEGDKPAEGAEGAEGGEKAPKEGEEKPAAKPDAKPAPKAEDKSGEDVLDRLRNLLETTPASKPEEKPAPKAEEPPPLFTEEEQKFLSDYDKEWPDVAKAEAMKRRGEYSQLVGHIFREVHKQYQPLLQMVEALAAKAQYSEIKETVPDYNDDEVDKIQAWVKEQPDYLQDAYNSVITGGTPKQVADLITRYRTATGTAGQQSQGGKPAPAPTKKAEQELPASAKQAAASLAPVGSKRSAVVSGSVDPEDFSGAFDTFAKQA